MTTASGSERGTSVGVLSGLDRQTTTGFYWYLTVLACIGGFLFGYDTAVSCLNRTTDSARNAGSKSRSVIIR